MAVRFDSLDAFRAAISTLGLPLTEDELRTVWPMARDLLEQAEILRRFLETMPGASLLAEAVREAGDR